jgi:hypothetical protein
MEKEYKVSTEKMELIQLKLSPAILSNGLASSTDHNDDTQRNRSVDSTDEGDDGAEVSRSPPVTNTDPHISTPVDTFQVFMDIIYGLRRRVYVLVPRLWVL